MTGGAKCFVAGGAECFVGTFLVVLSAHPNLPHVLSSSQSSLCSSSFLQMGQCGPHEHFSTTCLGITIAWGIAATWGGASGFIVGVGVGVGVE